MDTRPEEDGMAGQMHRIEIDRSKKLTEDPRNGHNRWHPDIRPAVRIQPGDSVELPTRDAFDGQLSRETQAADLANADLSVVHPLTGPVYVEGAEAGDLLEIEIGEITPEPFGYTVQVP